MSSGLQAEALATIEARLRAAGVVPVVELPDADLAVPLAEALLAGGLTCVEITFRTPAARDGLAAIREAYPEILLGAGTVLEEEQVDVAIELGADFAVAPGTSPAVVRHAEQRDLPMLPGTCTPTDVEAARRLGLRLLKFFPAEPVGGARLSRRALRALQGCPLRADRLHHAGDASRLSRDSAGCGMRRKLDGEARPAPRPRLEPGHRARSRGCGNRGGRAMKELSLRERGECRFELVALGEVMLRLDPGPVRVATARRFDVWEGGGEYNVARGLRRCFGLPTAVVTALVDNPVGRLVEDLMLTGGVETSHVVWLPFDGVGRAARNGLNFTDRGFGVRGAIGCSDRGHTAASQLRPGQIDWDAILGREGVRWLHCGGIFCALSETTAEVAREAFEAARRHGTVVSYDLNYRESLWTSIGGRARAAEVNRELVSLVDVVVGNEEDYQLALGFDGRWRRSRADFARPPGIPRHARGCLLRLSGPLAPCRDASRGALGES